MSCNFSPLPLANVLPGQQARIYALVGPGKGARLRLAALGLRPGVTVRVLGHGPGSGPVLLEIDGTCVALGKGLARRILVVPERQEDEDSPSRAA